ncbi:unnamed protein product [Calypogeia fissa]
MASTLHSLKPTIIPLLSSTFPLSRFPLSVTSSNNSKKKKNDGIVSIPTALKCACHTTRRHFITTTLLALSSTSAISTSIGNGSWPPSLSQDASAMEGMVSLTSEIGAGKTVFVAGSTGNTGKRIVRELLERGFRVRAGCRDIAKAKQLLPYFYYHNNGVGNGDGDGSENSVDFVLADVTQGKEKLAQAMRGVDAVVVATGFRPNITDPLASWNVDNLGTVALVDACAMAGVKRFVLVSSLLVNGAAVGQILNPVYIALNLIGLTLVAKLQAERYVRQSGIEYTIIRPGGLTNQRPSGNTVLAPEDTLFDGSVSRDTVAQVAVDSLLYKESSFKVVELISRPDAPSKSVQELLAAIPS